jgi:hypothetical protein
MARPIVVLAALVFVASQAPAPDPGRISASGSL